MTSHRLHKPSYGPIRLDRKHRFALFAALVLVVVTGAVWLPLHYFMPVATDFGELPHPFAQPVMVAHGMAALWMLVAFGSMLPAHMRSALRLRRNRSSGYALVLLFLWLLVSAHALYYFPAEDGEGWIGPAHWVAGLLLPFIVFLHRRGSSHPDIRPV